MLYRSLKRCNHLIELTPLIKQHFAMQLQRLLLIEGRTADDLLNLLQGKTKLPEKQNLLQHFQVLIRIPAIA
ncbi:hypothetical protein D3C80_1744910 [compost metagenome]